MNKMITQAYRVGQTALRVAGYVGQGMKWTENIVNKTTGGVMRFGGYFSSLGSDVLLFRDGGFSTVGWTALAVPLKTVGWGIKGSALFTRGVVKGAFRTAEFVGRQASATASFVGFVWRQACATAEMLIDAQPVAEAGDKLAMKADILDKESAVARAGREQAVQQAEKEGTPLTATQVMALRKVEDQKRFEAYKRMALNARRKIEDQKRFETYERMVLGARSR